MANVNELSDSLNRLFSEGGAAADAAAAIVAAGQHLQDAMGELDAIVEGSTNQQVHQLYGRLTEVAGHVGEAVVGMVGAFGIKEQVLSRWICLTYDAPSPFEVPPAPQHDERLEPSAARVAAEPNGE